MQSEGLFFFISYPGRRILALTSLPMAALRGHAGQVCTAGTRTALRGRAGVSWKQ